MKFNMIEWQVKLIECVTKYIHEMQLSILINITILFNIVIMHMKSNYFMLVV